MPLFASFVGGLGSFITGSNTVSDLLFAEFQWGVASQLDLPRQIIVAACIVPCTLEILDHSTIKYVEDYTQAGLPVDAQAILLIEVDGHPAQVAEEAEKVVVICKKSGAVNVQAAKDEAERNKLWDARRAALPALARARPTTVLEDATVPRSQIPAMIRAISARVIIQDHCHPVDNLSSLPKLNLIWFSNRFRWRQANKMMESKATDRCLKISLLSTTTRSCSTHWRAW